MIMIKNTSAQLYDALLYTKEDIKAIQKKLGFNGNTNQTVTHQIKKAKTLADTYELFLDLVANIILIQKNLNIDGNPILEVELRSNRASTDILYKELLMLTLDLDYDIIAIQEELHIVGYTNQPEVEDADEEARAYLQKFEKFHGPLEDGLDVILKKCGEVGVKKIWFTRKGLPLFPKLSPQQLHEVFVKNSAGTDQCPCLEQVS